MCGLSSYIRISTRNEKNGEKIISPLQVEVIIMIYDYREVGRNNTNSFLVAFTHKLVTGNWLGGKVSIAGGSKLFSRLALLLLEAPSGQR